MNKAYFMSAARYALAGSVILSVLAAVVLGAFGVFIAVAVPFLVLFPIVLLTKPAIERAAKAGNERLTAWLASKKDKQKRNENGKETFS